MYANYMQIR